MTGEFAFIDWLRARTPAAAHVALGPGDDTAAVRWPGPGDVLLTTDMLMDGTDFILADVSPHRAGRKAMAVNLSDIAAMAGVPRAALVAVSLPKSGGRTLAEGLYAGLREMADAFETPIVGGDTNSWDGPLVICVTLVGEAVSPGPIRRSGASPGDWLFVTGPLGGSILGHHLDFTPRIREALALLPFGLKAMLDISDGLSADLHHLCDESRCGAVLRADAIPISDAARTTDGVPIERALGDGEDFELLFAVTPEVGETLRRQPIPGVTLSHIGECVEAGVWLERAGTREALPPRGWVHALE